jgi:hypothetical protein
MAVPRPNITEFRRVSSESPAKSRRASHRWTERSNDHTIIHGGVKGRRVGTCGQSCAPVLRLAHRPVFGCQSSDCGSGGGSSGGGDGGRTGEGRTPTLARVKNSIASNEL